MPLSSTLSFWISDINFWFSPFKIFFSSFAAYRSFFFSVMSSCFRSTSSCYLFTLISFLNLFIKRSSKSCWGRSSSDYKSSSLFYNSLISLALSGSCSCLLTTSTSGICSCELRVYESTLSVIWDPASLGVFFLRSSFLLSSLIWGYWFLSLCLIISFATSWKASS